MEYRLIITSGNKGIFETELLPNQCNVFEEKDINNLLDTDDTHVFFSRESYMFQISPAPKDTVGGTLFFNETQPKLSEFDDIAAYFYDLDKGSFGVTANMQFTPFADVWGYVQICIRLEFKDGHFEDLYTRYISVDNDSVNMTGMASFVYQGFPELLSKNSVLKSKIYSDLNKMTVGPLDLKLGLIRRTARIYDKNYNYYMTNARFTTKQIEAVVKFEKLNYVTTNSLRYVVQHPEELYQVHTFNGIKSGRQVYHPRHIQTSKSIISYDIYENHVLLDFLDLMLKQIDGIKKTLNELLTEHTGNILLLFEQMFSKDYIESKLPEVDYLQIYLTKLLRRYSTALKLKPTVIKRSPIATHIFREVPQYREIFECIQEWYKGVYDFDQSRFLLQCIGSSRLYESFVLTALLENLKSKGYIIEPSRYEYDVIDELYQNTTFNNTFICNNGEQIITVYYQPVIYSDQRALNGINLMRRPKGSSIQYYTPDYIFKIEKGNSGPVKVLNATYIICDAKFSNLETVQVQSLKKVYEKYEYGIVPLPGANKENTCIVYGKYDNRDPRLILFGETHIYEQKPPEYKPTVSIVPIAYELYKQNPDSFQLNVEELYRVGRRTNAPTIE